MQIKNDNIQFKPFLALVLAMMIAADVQAGGCEVPPDQLKPRDHRFLDKALQEGSIVQQQYDETLLWLNQEPCALVNQSLGSKTKKALEIALAKQKGLQHVEVMRVFYYAGWTIVYANDNVADPTYHFYNENPIKAKQPVTVWSGAAAFFETTEIYTWLLKQAQGIPDPLAKCFAWHVTLDRHSGEKF